MERKCSEAGCGGEYYAKGLCGTHYQRARAASLPSTPCSETGCVERALNLKLALCQRHNDARKNATHRKKIQSDPELLARRRASARATYQRRRESKLERSRQYRAANRELGRAQAERWRKANPERAREIKRQSQALRKARRLQTQTEAVDYAAILALHGMTCHICGGEIPTRADLHFDHVIPLAKGGPHVMDNIKPSHARCNLSKGARVA